MLISYNWLKSYIPEIPDATKVADLITFHLCEIESVEKLPPLSPTDSSPQAGEQDTVFDLKILPDRAHDLLSHQGVAREVAGLLGISFKLPEYKLPESKPTKLDIQIESKNCRRYMGRIIRNIKIGPSREWMVKFLESVGQRSINNIVDASNIVMYDCGQPTHAFDLKKLSNEKIVIKQAEEGDKLDLVGSEKLTAILKSSDLVITDGEKNVAIAGVKGGLDSSVNDTTTEILIEVANFDPVSVRKTARRLGILTDASKRFENDLTSSLCDFAMNELSALILEMCPNATFEEVVDVYPIKIQERSVSFLGSYISKMLGLKIEDKEIEKILKNYNYNFTHEGDEWKVAVPIMRLDLTGPHDFVEEIGRAYGYEKIIPVLPEVNFKSKDNIAWVKICVAKQKLIEEGYKEVMTYVFRDKGDLEVLASASDKNFLRTNLTDGLKESIKLNILNLPLLDMKEIKVFEIGTVFYKDKEEMHVAYGDKKNVTEVNLDEFIKAVPQEFHFENTKEQKTFKPWSVYPFISRDIAVWVREGVAPEVLIDIYKDFGTELLIKEPYLFDSFTKEGRTSYAYRLVFQSDEKTLTDEEVNPIMDKITEKISSLGWQVR